MEPSQITNTTVAMTLTLAAFTTTGETSV